MELVYRGCAGGAQASNPLVEDPDCSHFSFTTAATARQSSTTATFERMILIFGIGGQVHREKQVDRALRHQKHIYLITGPKRGTINS